MTRIVRKGREVFTKLVATQQHRDQRIYEDLAKESARQKQMENMTENIMRTVNDSIIALEKKLNLKFQSKQ